MGKDQHRWKLSVSDHARRVLEESAQRLKWAWETDKKYPKSYPSNTDCEFAEINRQLTKGSGGKSRTLQDTGQVPPSPSLPKRLSELVHEKTIKTVYEQQNDGSYQGALKSAASGDEAAWRKILRAVSAAYLVDRLSPELAPKPQIHFLHRELLDIANLTGLSEITHQGIVEFLDDLCPCGKRHQPEAIRKLRKRWTGSGHAER